MDTIQPKQGGTHTQQKKFSVPEYITSRSEGFYIILSKINATSEFELFINRIFFESLYLSELNYDLFLKLLYDEEWLVATRNKLTEIKLAAGIVPFPQQRFELYKSVKLLDRGKQAEYVFEPANIEVRIETPIYGDPGADGIAPVIRKEQKNTLQPVTLDFDEFVAVMWAKGIRYGINVEECRKAISNRTATRMIVANYLAPTEGKDADILEVCPDLHRDNSPKTLLNGKADMRAFKNRFPHIAKGAKLLKKIPRVLGKHGYKVTGELIEPAIPKDLNLLALASTGTTARMEADGDYLIAEMDGFLNIDPVHNTISITEKIETTAGVSMKTTGDLMLNVEEFIEHGEVQEGRVVKGRHMNFKSNVFGKLVSSGGNIIVKGNLTGGGADATDGNITLNRASRSVVYALNGVVTLKYCENCTIVGHIIHVEQAINSELIAAEINAGAIEGCMLAATSIKVLTSTESKRRETLITMIVPDLSEFDKGIEQLRNKISESQVGIAGKKQEIMQLQSDADFVKFLALYDKIKSGEIKLTTEQAGNWQKLVSKNAKSSSQMENINKQIAALEQAGTEAEAEIVKINQSRTSAGQDISCSIESVTGQTTGQTLISPIGIKLFSDMNENDIRMHLQKVEGQRARIFSADDGSVTWLYK